LDQVKTLEKFQRESGKVLRGIITVDLDGLM